jgi:dTDP-L-rhamnose 4-epimerase
MENVLVTGGAGFIGSHVVDLLLQSGYQVTIIDGLEEQVHRLRKSPDHLDSRARFIVSRVGNRALLKEILAEVDAIIHLAATVGVGQSMYQIHRYIDSNTNDTAALLEELVNGPSSVTKLVVASSMSIYGEGKYFCSECSRSVYPGQRSLESLKAQSWDHSCPTCKTTLIQVPTDEQTPPSPTSIYAMSKRHQEEMCLLTGKTYGLKTVALRFFNVYGPRQALSNPYTGACAMMSSRILNSKPPYIFEDGMQLRDFIYVKDVAQACLLALESNRVDFQAVNVGTGRPVSILDLARNLIDLYAAKLTPHISYQFRKGDIRHCYADITKAKELMNFRALTDLRTGLLDLVEWAKSHGWGAVDLFEKALIELREKQLAE